MSAPTAIERRPSRSDRAANRSTPRDVAAASDLPNTLDAEAKSRINVLVVDDEHTIRESCSSVLRHENYSVAVCARGQEAIDLLARKRFQIVLVDLHLAQVDGLAVLQTAIKTNPDSLVIMMTGKPSIESSVDALRQGAWDYLPKPFSATQLQILVGRAAHTFMISQETDDRPQQDALPDTLVGASPAFRAMIELATKVATTDASVFITGESGSGKEVIARFIHSRSRRASRPFVAVNCAALPEMLLESEMFGHRKGAFTDAVREKPGLMETANGGTLFLDELIEMAKPIQAKLLRVIQDGVVRRVGSESTDAVVNVRFLAATNRPPETAIQDGSLREDLFYRLRVVPIHVPPLRERREDIRLLAERFVATYWAKHRAKNGGAPPFTDAAIHALESHPWHGNVRELQNVIEHAVVLADADAPIDANALVLSPDAPRPPVARDTMRFSPAIVDEGYHAARERTIGEFEIQYLMWLLDRAGGNMSRAARVAGVDRTTLYRLLERHDLHRSPQTGWIVERHPTPAEPVAVHAHEPEPQPAAL
ncbi:MAG TPA: sigma-54 dependent transcriptional regulator [Gemmatimonadaceae bacterium]|nr:sigma-54 dependent transcriptional regulator [Gemmatimonadaceae bacterium]